MLEAPRRFKIADRPPRAAAADGVLVRIAATAVCHTDLSIYTGTHPGVRYPVVMGHECTGVVEAVGADVVGLAPGMPILINPIMSCGRCDSCRRGAGNLCRNAGLFGREVEGSLTESVSVASRYAHRLPPQLSLVEATLIETLATVRHAQQRLAIAPGESVVVLGAGTTGLLHARLAVLAGANPVIAVSRTHWKLDRAARLGAHHAVSASAEVAAGEVARLTGGLGADVVIDTTGGAAATAAAIEMLRPGGRFAPYAVSHECCPDFSMFPLYSKEITIVGSRALNAEDVEPSIALVATGRVDVSGFVTTTYPLSHTAAAFEEYERNPRGVLRIVIESNAS